VHPLVRALARSRSRALTHSRPFPHTCHRTHLLCRLHTLLRHTHSLLPHHGWRFLTPHRALVWCLVVLCLPWRQVIDTSFTFSFFHKEPIDPSECFAFVVHIRFDGDVEGVLAGRCEPLIAATQPARDIVTLLMEPSPRIFIVRPLMFERGTVRTACAVGVMAVHVGVCVGGGRRLGVVVVAGVGEGRGRREGGREEEEKYEVVVLIVSVVWW
jgi:hypothetical protein